MNFDSLISTLRKSAETVGKVAEKLEINLPDDFAEQKIVLNNCLDTCSASKAMISAVVADARGEFSLESLSELTSNFDKNWDDFAKEYNEIFNSSTDAQQRNVLEVFAKTHLSDSVFNAGSIIKNEAPVILNGISTVNSGLTSFKGSYREPKIVISKVKSGIDNISKAVESVSASLNGIAKTIQGGKDATGILLLDNLSKLSSSRLMTSVNALVGISEMGIGAWNNASDLLNDIKRGDFDSMLATLRKSAESIDNIAQKFNTAFDFSEEKFKLNECLDICSASKVMISGVIADVRGDFSVESISELISNFDKNWDIFAKEYNDIFNRSTCSEQKNILETFVRTHFSDRVFNAGSVVKNEVPAILSGLSALKSGIYSFKGSYHDPQTAISKIKTGVKAISMACKSISSSLGTIVSKLSGDKGYAGATLLKKLIEFPDGKLITYTDSSLEIAGDGLTTWGSTSKLIDDIEKRDLKAALKSGKETVKNAKKLYKDVKNFRKGIAAEESVPTTVSEIQNTDEESGGEAKSDSYVCSGAKIQCTFGEKDAKLSVYPDRTVSLTDLPMANITDRISLYHIASFGKCRTTKYPPTGSATAAHKGKLTPMPCIPGTDTDWKNGKDDYLIKGNPALLKSSYCKCKWGGVITIVEDGQKETSPADLSKESLDC